VPREPYVFLRLRNTSDTDLYTALLDLTDRHRCSVLFPTERIAAGHAVDVFDGAIDVSLPKGRAVEPGAQGRDWLKVLVSAHDFDASSFELPELGEPSTRAATSAPRTTLERLACRAVHRGVGEEAADETGVAAAADWSATTIPLVVAVPPPPT
jgi:hypothetical protein